MMKTERNKILHQIKKKLLIPKEGCLDNWVKQIDKIKESRKCSKQLRCDQGKDLKTLAYMEDM